MLCRKIFIATISAYLFAGAVISRGIEVPAPSNLRIEYLGDPAVIDAAQPRFSWILSHPERNQAQKAFQVLVSAHPEASEGDVWDSGKVMSPASTQVVYAGKALESNRTYFWRVRWWDVEDRVSPYSRVARFDTGLLRSEDWHASWIGGENQLRKEFILTAAPRRARAYVSSLGWYELRLNGQKVGDHVLDPAWTTQSKRVLYSTFDVTRQLVAGRNAAAILLGSGRTGRKGALLQLEIELADGTRTRIASDATWRTAAGPIVSDSVFDGETYDARSEMPGWDQPGYQDSGWKEAALLPAPPGRMAAQAIPPIRVVDELVPLKMTNPQPGVYVYDAGQNLSGWVRLRVRGPRGAHVRIRHAELLHEDGMLNIDTLWAARATDVYILRGDGSEEVWEPRFTYHGFRYVELTGFPGTPRLDTIRVRVVRSDLRPAGGFASSKPILNRLQSAILWGIGSNLFGLPTDCNQRNERLGWLADAYAYGETARLNFDAAAFYAKYLNDIRDVQKPDGRMNDTAPNGCCAEVDPAWGSAYPLLVWNQYLYEGDRRALEEHYDGIKGWVDYLTTRAHDHLIGNEGRGDWVELDATPVSLVSSYYYYSSVQLTARIAQILGKTADADRYTALGSEIREAFRRRFWDERNQYYGNGSQTSQAMALTLDLATPEQRAAVYMQLHNEIMLRHNLHLTTGIFGTKLVMELLDGRETPISPLFYFGLGYELATQTTYPSWGYMLENGATTLWEIWQHRTGPSVGTSQNHPMLGSVGAWLYHVLAGIRPDPEVPGFRRIRIAPLAPGDLKFASGTFDSPQGTILSSWKREDGAFKLEVQIPVGSTAEVWLPKERRQHVVVTESGKTVWDERAIGPGKARETGDSVIFEVGSGHYQFEEREKL